MTRSGWTRGIALATLVGFAGCYRYTPAEPAAVPPGQRVRVFVTREALTGLGDFAVGEGAKLDGTLIRAEPSRLVLRLPVATRQSGFRMEVLGQDVFLPREQVIEVELREVNKPITALMVVAGTAALTGLVITIIQNAVQGEQHPPSEDVELRFSVP
jgi:hypothetical protein